MKQRQLIVAAGQRNLVQCAGWARPNAGQASNTGGLYHDHWSLRMLSVAMGHRQGKQCFEGQNGMHKSQRVHDES